MLKRIIGIVVVGAICAALVGCASGVEAQNPAKDLAASGHVADEASTASGQSGADASSTEGALPNESALSAKDAVSTEDALSTENAASNADTPSAEDTAFSKNASSVESAPVESEQLRMGKDQITVLVLNANGVEGSAAEAAEDIKSLGFEHVSVGNATFHHEGNRVSYHHEEHRGEVEEVAALFGSLPPYDPYCYEDASNGGWSMDYDILVMLGEPGAVYPISI